ncbi:MAG: hypothetical protein KF746_24935 [Chitinophagaceae bacterium]|nr:hypothetical protein [Chitinophagaceae bacterium]
MMEYKDNIDKELFEKIEAYIQNRMNAGDRTAFEKEIQADETLRNEVALQRQLIASVQVFTHHKEDSFKASSDVKAPVKKMRHVWMYAAAAVTALIAVTWFYQYKTATGEQVYANYFTPDAGLPVMMSGENDRYDFYNGMVSYKEGEYDKAIEIWRGIAQPSDTISYFTGVAYLNNKNAEASIAHLATVALNDKSAWQQKAIWYLALAYVKMNNKDKALEWLNKLPDNEQAKLLMRDIQKTLP